MASKSPWNAATSNPTLSCSKTPLSSPPKRETHSGFRLPRGRRRCGGAVRGSRRGGTRFCKVTATRPYLIAVVIGYFDFDFVIFAVGDKVARTVGDRVLIPEFVPNVLEGLAQIVYVIREKRAPTGLFCQVL